MSKQKKLKIAVDSSVVRLQGMLVKGLKEMSATGNNFDRKIVFEIADCLSTTYTHGRSPGFISDNRNNYKATLRKLGYSKDEIDSIDLLR